MQKERAPLRRTWMGQSHRKCVGYLPNGNRKVLTDGKQQGHVHQGDEEERGRVEPGMRPLHHRAGIYSNRAMRGASAVSGREWGTEAEVH